MAVQVQRGGETGVMLVVGLLEPSHGSQHQLREYTIDLHSCAEEVEVLQVHLQEGTGYICRRGQDSLI